MECDFLVSQWFSKCGPRTPAGFSALSGDLRVLLFPVTYLCKAELSSYTLAKVTYYSKLNAGAYMGLQLSSIKLDIKRFAKM